MEISVARFKCAHPNCTLRANNDFSVQTIYEHIGQHLFQDTGSFDHFNLHCSCSTKYHFALMPYATVHLDHDNHDGSRHQIIMCSPISLNDVNASKMILSYQKRFIQFSGYKIEIDTCPDLTVNARKSNVPRNQAAPAMNSVPAKNYGSHQSLHERHFKNRDREVSPINVRTPVFGRSPSPPPKRSACRPSAPYDSREPPRSNGNRGGFNRHESPSRQGRQSGPYSPPRESFDPSGFGRARSVGPREQHGGRSPPPPPPITPRRGGFDRSSFGRNSDGRSSGNLDSQDRRSSAPYSPQRGRSDRDGFNSDRGRSFGRENSGDGEKRSFGDRGGFGRGHGRGRGGGRGSDENGQNRFGGRHVDNINSHMASNRGNVGSGDGPEPDGVRKRQREGLSPRSSDDEGQKGEPNARRSGNPVNVDRNGNSDSRGNAFNGGNAKNKAAGKTIRCDFLFLFHLTTRIKKSSPSDKYSFKICLFV